MTAFNSKWAQWDAKGASDGTDITAKSPYPATNVSKVSEPTSTYPEVEALERVSDDDLAMAVAAYIILNAKAKC